MRKASVVVIKNEDKYLAVSRGIGSSKYGLIGGKCEANETPEQAAIREAFEESGMNIHSLIQVYRTIVPKTLDDGFDFDAYAFYATSYSGLPTSSHEGDVKWVSKEELIGESGAFPEYNKKVIEICERLFK